MFGATSLCNGSIPFDPLQACRCWVVFKPVEKLGKQSRSITALDPAGVRVSARHSLLPPHLG